MSRNKVLMTVLTLFFPSRIPQCLNKVCGWDVTFGQNAANKLMIYAHHAVALRVFPPHKVFCSGLCDGKKEALILMIMTRKHYIDFVIIAECHLISYSIIIKIFPFWQALNQTPDIFQHKAFKLNAIKPSLIVLLFLVPYVIACGHGLYAHRYRLAHRYRPTHTHTHTHTLLVHLPKCCRLGDMVSSSVLCRCRGDGTALSNQSCCSDLALLWRSPAFWNPGPPVATGNGHCPEVTIHQHLQN